MSQPKLKPYVSCTQSSSASRSKHMGHASHSKPTMTDSFPRHSAICFSIPFNDKVCATYTAQLLGVDNLKIPFLWNFEDCHLADKILSFRVLELCLFVGRETYSLQLQRKKNKKIIIPAAIETSDPTLLVRALHSTLSKVGSVQFAFP